MATTKVPNLSRKSDRLLGESNVQEQEPIIEFTTVVAPIKRFRSFEDYDASLELAWEQSRLTGTPLLIQESLKPYLKFARDIPPAELAMVNHEGKVIIVDTLYSLHGDSYSKRHIAGGQPQVFALEIYYPPYAMAQLLNAAMQTVQVSSAMGIWGAQNSSGTQSGCGSPNNFNFVTTPGQRPNQTYMCVADFTYPQIRLNPGDYDYTSNGPGAVVMWNTSYRTWSHRAWAESYTVYYKYINVDGESKLATVGIGDLPNTVAYSTWTKVQTKKRRGFGCHKKKKNTSEARGGLSTRANVKRCAGTGTQSWHTALMTGINGLPNNRYLE